MKSKRQEIMKRAQVVLEKAKVVLSENSLKEHLAVPKNVTKNLSDLYT